MLRHLSFGVADLDRAAGFYDRVLAPLGYARLDITARWRLGTAPSHFRRAERPETSAKKSAPQHAQLRFPGRVGWPEVVRGTDQADMREGLREVADLPPEIRVILLRQQPNVVPQIQQALKQAVGIVSSAQ